MRNNKTVYLSLEGSRQIHTVEIDQKTSLGDLIKKYAPGLARSKDFNEDLEGYLLNSDDDLRKDVPLASMDLGRKAHIILTRCQKVKVNVLYNGGTYADEFNPSNRVARVWRKAIKHFQINDDDATSLKLWLEDETEDVLMDNEFIGAFASYPACSVTLILSVDQDVQG